MLSPTRKPQLMTPPHSGVSKSAPHVGQAATLSIWRVWSTDINRRALQGVPSASLANTDNTHSIGVLFHDSTSAAVTSLAHPAEWQGTRISDSALE